MILEYKTYTSSNKSYDNLVTMIDEIFSGDRRRIFDEAKNKLEELKSEGKVLLRSSELRDGNKFVTITLYANEDAREEFDSFVSSIEGLNDFYKSVKEDGFSYDVSTEEI